MDAAIIAVWTQPDSKGTRIVVFDDNHVEDVTAKQWPALWQADAQARIRLKLPSASPPPETQSVDRK
jgi:hypothetical protein